MIDVPHCRDVKIGSRGLDVVGYKRALSRAGFMQAGQFTPMFGPFAEKATKAFQRASGLTDDGVIGTDTHHALEAATRKNGAAAEPVFDDLAVKLMTEFCQTHGQARDAATRAEIVAAARFWQAHRDGIDYSQNRPFTLAKPPTVPARIDCSGFVTICYLAGGGPDPNGRGYDGQGYTGTLLPHGKRITKDQLQPADLVFYGSTTHATPAFPVGSPTHVALYVGGGMVIEMGSPPGPLLVSLGYRSDFNCCATYAMA